MMPSKVAIVSDSTSYLPQDCLKQYNISVTILSVLWGEQMYRDGVDILPGEFYRRLAVTHVNSEREALSFLQTARGLLDPVETFTCPLRRVIGTHVGPGTLALNYMSGID